jgi:hypothetical protein
MMPITSSAIPSVRRFSQVGRLNCCAGAGVSGECVPAPVFVDGGLAGLATPLCGALAPGGVTAGAAWPFGGCAPGVLWCCEEALDCCMVGVPAEVGAKCAALFALVRLAPPPLGLFTGAERAVLPPERGNVTRPLTSSTSPSIAATAPNRCTQRTISCRRPRRPPFRNSFRPASVPWSPKARIGSRATPARDGA